GAERVTPVGETGIPGAQKAGQPGEALLAPFDPRLGRAIGAEELLVGIAARLDPSGQATREYRGQRHRPKGPERGDGAARDERGDDRADEEPGDQPLQTESFVHHDGVLLCPRASDRMTSNRSLPLCLAAPALNDR